MNKNFIQNFFFIILFMSVTLSVSARQEERFVAQITGFELGDGAQSKKDPIPTIPTVELQNILLQNAQQQYGRDVFLKNFTFSKKKEGYNRPYYEYTMRADVYRYVYVEDPKPVVIQTPPQDEKPAEPKINESTAIEKAINKAMESISTGARIAINIINTDSGLSREQIKDIILDSLLDGGYKVVAKEYLEKLKEEIEEQQSGEYNSRTTVKTDNFSAVGYFIDVKMKNKTARVYLINVSTGEYASTANQSYD